MGRDHLTMDIFHSKPEICYYVSKCIIKKKEKKKNSFITHKTRSNIIYRFDGTYTLRVLHFMHAHKENDKNCMEIKHTNEDFSYKKNNKKKTTTMKKQRHTILVWTEMTYVSDIIGFVCCFFFVVIENCISCFAYKIFFKNN